MRPRLTAHQADVSNHRHLTAGRIATTLTGGCESLTRTPVRPIYRWEYPAIFAAGDRAHDVTGDANTPAVRIKRPRTLSFELSMDDRDSQPKVSDQLSVRSATSLRELEQRAHKALSASREQASLLEAKISKQLEQIAASLQEQAAAAERIDAEQIDCTHAQIEQLAAELASSHQAWQAERAALEANREQLVNRVATLEAEHKDWLAERSEFEVARDQLTQKVTTLEAEQQVLPTSVEVAALQDELKQLEAAAAKERSILEAARDEIVGQVANLDSERRELQERWAQERSALEAARDALAQEVAKLESNQRPQEESWSAERTAFETARGKATQEADQLEAEQQAQQTAWKTQLAEFERKLSEQQSIWSDQRTEWNDERAALERERDELRQKFELALADVQRFRGRVAELEQDLARRPESNEADSAELVALRAERDALSEQVEQLERQPVAQIDANVEQQLSDLQRRFELAVEDVRELKTKNAKLEAQLASTGKPAPAAIDGGGMDWESQKRRLLASLEGGGDESDEPERQKECVTIEDTIEMTHAVVAEKDREIAALKLQLATGGSQSRLAEEVRDQRISDLVDDDQVIAEHRKRIAQVERETEEKLRAAELELSIERAKMARQKSELENLRADIESQRSAYDAAGGNTSAAGVPRRRWLSKLGLDGQEK